MPPKQIISSVAFQDPQGTVLANGFLTLDLSQAAVITGSGGQVAPIRVDVALDANGKVPVPTLIYGNDQLTPSGTSYYVRVYNSNNLLVSTPGPWIIQGTSPIDVSLLIPTNVGASYPAVADLAGNNVFTGLNTFNQLTTFVAGITGGGTIGTLGLGSGALGAPNVWGATQTFPVGSIAVNELVPSITNGQSLVTSGGTVVWADGVRINGALAPAPANFGNLPAAQTNNILGVWQRSASNASVEIPASGNGAFAMSGAGSFTAGHGVAVDAGGNLVDSGVVPLMKFAKKVTGCNTGGGSNSACQDTLTWAGGAFSSTPTYVVCQGMTPNQFIGQSTTNQAAVLVIDSYSTTGVVTTTETMRSTAAQFSEIHCIGIQ